MKRALLVLLLVLLPCALADFRKASVVLQNGTRYVFHDRWVPSAVAWGQVNGTLSQTGWDRLHLFTNASFTDTQQAYAAGYLEACLFQPRAYQAYQNIFVGLLGWDTDSKIPQKIAQYLRRNAQWIATAIDTYADTDSYWKAAQVIWQQLAGIYAGYRDTAPVSERLSDLQLQVAAYGPDVLMDLIPALTGGQSPAAARTAFAKDHCSAIVKLAADFSDIFFGHATWQHYGLMLRTFKTYHFAFRSAAHKVLTFSGYPGALTSNDDFYLTDNGMAVTETSLKIYNTSLYSYLNPIGQLPGWLRSRIALHIANSTSEWVTGFISHSSGTFNNQWLVLDLKKFTPGQPLGDNAFYVVEQIPGTSVIADHTATLEYGYFPSYNVPSDPGLFKLAGFADEIKRGGPPVADVISYQACARANIFRRDQTKVLSAQDLTDLLESNHYRTDPLSKGNPMLTIASRGDLIADKPACFGAIDSKVGSWRMWKDGMRVLARSGPTQQAGVFRFSDHPGLCPPTLGLPSAFAFPVQEFNATN